MRRIPMRSHISYILCMFMNMCLPSSFSCYAWVYCHTHAHHTAFLPFCCYHVVASCSLTVTSKTVAIFNLDVVREVHYKHPWEFHFALVGTNKAQTLGYKSILGSCDLVQWLWRHGHSKSAIPLQQFCIL